MNLKTFIDLKALGDERFLQLLLKHGKDLMPTSRCKTLLFYKKYEVPSKYATKFH
jgi:hypothetical protein